MADSFGCDFAPQWNKTIQKLLVTPEDACTTIRVTSREMLAILGFFGATVLAFRFNVLVLLPAILFGWILVLGNGLLTARSGAAITFHIVLVAIALQLGYLAGIILKWALLASRCRGESSKPVMAPNGRF